MSRRALILSDMAWREASIHIISKASLSPAAILGISYHRQPIVSAEADIVIVDIIVVKVPESLRWIVGFSQIFCKRLHIGDGVGYGDRRCFIFGEQRDVV